MTHLIVRAMREPLRRRGARLVTGLVLALMPILAVPASASAGTDYYCNSCVIYNNSGIIDTYSWPLTVSYVHYLGTGDRYLGAGAYNYASFVWGYNEVSHDYGGGNWLYAEAWDASGHDVTVNAHADY